MKNYTKTKRGEAVEPGDTASIFQGVTNIALKYSKPYRPVMRYRIQRSLALFSSQFLNYLLLLGLKEKLEGNKDRKPFHPLNFNNTSGKILFLASVDHCQCPFLTLFGMLLQSKLFTNKFKISCYFI